MEFKDAAWTLGVLGIPTVTVPGSSVDFVLNGRDPADFVPDLASVSGNRAGLHDPDGRLLAVVERANDRWTFLFVDRGAAR
jgi:hypothetical protein